MSELCICVRNIFLLFEFSAQIFPAIAIINSFVFNVEFKQFVTEYDIGIVFSWNAD